MKNKLYIVRKFIMAESAAQAIKRDKVTEVDEVWVDEKWKENNMSNEKKDIKFNQ